MTKRVFDIVCSMEESGQSAQIAVADHLQTVAGNRGSDNDEAMIEELRALRDCATEALAKLEKRETAKRSHTKGVQS